LAIASCGEGEGGRREKRKGEEGKLEKHSIS